MSALAKPPSLILTGGSPSSPGLTCSSVLPSDPRLIHKHTQQHTHSDVMQLSHDFHCIFQIHSTANTVRPLHLTWCWGTLTGSEWVITGLLCFQLQGEVTVITGSVLVLYIPVIGLWLLNLFKEGMNESTGLVLWNKGSSKTSSFPPLVSLARSVERELKVCQSYTSATRAFEPGGLSCFRFPHATIR